MVLLHFSGNKKTGRDDSCNRLSRIFSTSPVSPYHSNAQYWFHIPERFFQTAGSPLQWVPFPDNIFLQFNNNSPALRRDIHHRHWLLIFLFFLSATAVLQLPHWSLFSASLYSYYIGFRLVNETTLYISMFFMLLILLFILGFLILYCPELLIFLSLLLCAYIIVSIIIAFLSWFFSKRDRFCPEAISNHSILVYLPFKQAESPCLLFLIRPHSPDFSVLSSLHCDLHKDIVPTPYRTWADEFSDYAFLLKDDWDMPESFFS